jgi:hypothetical protein
LILPAHPAPCGKILNPQLFRFDTMIHCATIVDERGQKRSKVADIDLENLVRGALWKDDMPQTD